VHSLVRNKLSVSKMHGTTMKIIIKKLVYTLKSDVPSSVRTTEAKICFVVKKVSKYSDQFSLQ